MQTDFLALTPRVVLGVAAHPDDLDFGAAGTIATFLQQGAEVYYLLITDGSKGSADPAMTSDELIAMRRQEQRDALAALGGNPDNITFLDYHDGELEVTMDVKRDIIKAIRSHKPDVVITMDPAVLYSAERGMINHPDHRAAGQATLDAVFPLARDHLSFPELYEAGYQPHKTASLLLVNFNQSNFFVDITNAFESKIAALSAHKSQMTDMPKVRKHVESLATEAGAQSGHELAEGFVRIDIPE